MRGYACSSSLVADRVAEMPVSGMLPAPVCSGFVSWTEANAFCERAGARLCTFDEVRSGLAQDTGCGYDDRRIWTATRCKAGHHITYRWLVQREAANTASVHARRKRAKRRASDEKDRREMLR